VTASAAASADDIERCYELGWTDGLPVVPPTRVRVERMLGPDAARRHQVVAHLAPTGAAATLERIAANAVMAGCLPEYLPVVEAAVRAVGSEGFWLDDMITAIDHGGAVVLVGGPAARTLRLSGDGGALGPGTRANATIGRALNLILRNVAGLRHFDDGALDGWVFGHPGKFTCCYAENADCSPWPELHVERGFDARSSVVTVYAADPPFVLCEAARAEPEAILRTIAEALRSPRTFNAGSRAYDLWLIMAPEHANLIAAAGWGRADVQRFLFEHGRVSRDRLRERGYQGPIDDDRPPGRPESGEDPVAIVRRPAQIQITVAGAPYGGYSAVCFGFGSAVSRAIERT
jgi:hypothetical protein